MKEGRQTIEPLRPQSSRGSGANRALGENILYRAIPIVLGFGLFSLPTFAQDTPAPIEDTVEPDSMTPFEEGVEQLKSGNAVDAETIL